MNHTPSPARADEPSGDARRIAAFGQAIEALRREVEAQLGERDATHIRRIGTLSRSLEWVGRGLIYVSVEPVTFGLGTVALWAHKTLELMEIGHMALHGAYDGLPGAERYQSQTFRWKAPIAEESWKLGHNVRHHQYTNIQGRDPDLNFGGLRLSGRVPYRALHALQPISNLVSWFGFTTGINLHVCGILDVYLKEGRSEVLADREPKTVRAAHQAFVAKWLRYYGREYIFFPLLAGPFFAKVLLANLLSEVGRDLYAGAIIYCGHVGAADYPADTEPPTRAHWYAMQVEAARDVELPPVLSILCGALDRQIEHHLFPRLPPNRLRELAPRVRAICETYGVAYRSDSWPRTLRSVFAELRRLASPTAP
ncbi:MAG TPA: acyl-CoA desaturase [Polyangiales bacterium]|nr:acyl-CoA desaturase [Polyangiales bacterium]